MSLKSKKIIIYSLGVLAITLALLHPLVNYFGRKYINSKLKDGIEGHTGSIAAFRTNLFLGRYCLKDLTLYKLPIREIPLLDIDSTCFSLSWRALVKGEFRGRVGVFEATIAVIDDESKARSQNGLDASGWLPTADALFILDIENVQFREVDLLLLIPSVPKGFDVLKNLRGEISNITNIAYSNEESLAGIKVDGELGEHGELAISGQIDFMTPKHRYNLSAEIDNSMISEFNPLLKHYTGLDTKSGELYLGVTVEGSANRIKGSIKPILKDLDILYKKDDYKNLGEVITQHLGALGNLIFSNSKTNATGTIIEFEKEADDLKVFSFKAFIELLKNAFGESLKETLP